MNIVSMGMKYLGPTVATKIASMMGIQSPMVVKLIAAALPALLGSFSGKAASAGGAASLLSMLNDQPVDSPEAFENILSGPQGADVAQAGGGLLGDLLGGDTTNALAGALGRHGGVDAAQAQTLMGMIAPAALGTLKNQVTEGGLDANGLASMLAGQKENIAAAMPSGFAGELEGIGLLDALRPADAAAPSIATAQATAQAAAPSGGGGMFKWIAGIAAIALGAWYFLGGSAPEVPAMPDVSELAAGVDLNVGDVNVGEEFGSVMGTLGDTFTGITDTASAEAAVPGLEAASEQLGNLGELAGQLPESAQGAFGGIVGTALGALRPMIQSAIDASGAGAILQPIADNILSTLEGMAG